MATDFVADAVRRSTSKPVHKIPPPIDVTLSRPYQRSEFGLPADVYMFLFSFDFNSFAKRKNPEGAIAAFRQAFDLARRDGALVVKTINGTIRPEKLSEMHDLVGGDARIILVDEFFSREQVFGLQSVVDAFVSLHRSEGFGLGLAESMYLGKPVIGTAHSGNLEFIDRDNSCLGKTARGPGSETSSFRDTRWPESPCTAHQTQGKREWSIEHFKTRLTSGPATRAP